MYGNPNRINSDIIFQMVFNQEQINLKLGYIKEDDFDDIVIERFNNYVENLKTD